MANTDWVKQLMKLNKVNETKIQIILDIGPASGFRVKFAAGEM